MSRSRLTMLKPTLGTLETTLARAPSIPRASVKRLRGRALQKRRERWLRAHPLCGDRLGGPSGEHSVCVRAGIASAALVVDHIVPLADGGVDEPSNWQSLCTNPCHAAKSAAEATNRAKK